MWEPASGRRSEVASRSLSRSSMRAGLVDRESRCRKQHRAVAGDDDGVLIVCREAAVASSEPSSHPRPHRPARPTTDDGLDGQYEAFRQDILLLRIPVVRHRRWLMNRSANSVSFQRANHRESMPMDFSLDRAANLAHAVASLCHLSACSKAECTQATSRCARGEALPTRTVRAASAI